jgi:RNA recognition motif-containing protein
MNMMKGQETKTAGSTRRKREKSSSSSSSMLVEKDQEETDDQSDDDADILAAAAAWAELVDGHSSAVVDTVLPPKENLESRRDFKKKKKRKITPNGPKTASSSSVAKDDDRHPAGLTTTKFSLHVTQLIFDATEFDVRHHFASKGCAVTSVRLVYDYDDSGRHNKTFRGVAFVDVLGEESYNIALSQLHKSTLLGRKINVRPTKTKQELGNIVVRTREIVAQKIKEELDRVAKESEAGIDKSTSSGMEKKNKKIKVDHDTKKNRERSKVDIREQGVGTASKTATVEKKEGGVVTKKNDPIVKLTKKERNRRAAIILQRKRQC